MSREIGGAKSPESGAARATELLGGSVAPGGEVEALACGYAINPSPDPEFPTPGSSITFGLYGLGKNFLPSPMSLGSPEIACLATHSDPRKRLSYNGIQSFRSTSGGLAR